MTNMNSGWYIDPSTNIRYFYDGTQWFIQQNGILVPYNEGVRPLGSPGKGIIDGATWPRTKLQVGPGNQFRVNYEYYYIGPAVTGAVEKVSWGSWGITWTQKAEKTNTVNIPLCSTNTKITGSVIFTVPQNVVGDWTALYVLISGGSPAIGPTGIAYSNVLQIMSTNVTVTKVELLSVEIVST